MTISHDAICWSNPGSIGRFSTTFRQFYYILHLERWVTLSNAFVHRIKLGLMTKLISYCICVCLDFVDTCTENAGRCPRQTYALGIIKQTSKQHTRVWEIISRLWLSRNWQWWWWWWFANSIHCNANWCFSCPSMRTQISACFQAQSPIQYKIQYKTSDQTYFYNTKKYKSHSLRIGADVNGFICCHIKKWLPLTVRKETATFR